MQHWRSRQEHDENMALGRFEGRFRLIFGHGLSEPAWPLGAPWMRTPNGSPPTALRWPRAVDFPIRGLPCTTWNAGAPYGLASLKASLGLRVGL